jgi:hypothetical protein
MEDLVIILSVGKPYDITNEDGTHTTGCTMNYIATQDINQTSENPDSGELGYVPVKEKMPVTFYDNARIHGLPAVAKVTYGMRNSGGKQVLYIKALDFVGNKQPSK